MPDAIEIVRSLIVAVLKILSESREIALGGRKREHYCGDFLSGL